MINFIQNFAKIKPSLIAKDRNYDYGNIKNGVAKTSKIQDLTREIKKKIFTIFLIENLTDEEILAIQDISKDILQTNEYVLDSKDINNIYLVYKIFKEFV